MAGDELQHEYPILEFDSNRKALIEPRVKRPIDMPEHVVVCFFQDVIARLVEQQQAQIIKRLPSELGKQPVYELAFREQRLAVFHPGVGAPLAATFLEEVIALGGKTFIACGGAGVLESSITVGHILVPTTAVRDEGTSYHYLPPGREVSASPEGVAAIEATLTAHSIEYLLTKTWTTDAPFRETPAKIVRRKTEGCLAVEMEAAAFFAVAQFRGVQFAQMLYGGDDLGGAEWDYRAWDTHSVRETLFWLAAEACLRM